MYSYRQWCPFYTNYDGTSTQTPRYHSYAKPYHPQTNGQIECFNSTMDAKIAAFSNQYRSDWDDKLPFVIFNYNTSYHSTTKTIPFELMYGRSPVLPFDLQNSIVSLQQPSHSTQNIGQ